MSTDRRRWAALTDGYHLAFWVATALVALSVAIAMFVLKPVIAGDDRDALTQLLEPAGALPG
jgi:hypothetical protein